MSDVDFKKVLSDSGVLTTQDELEAQWKQDVVDSGSTINNDSVYSPFYKIISALVTQPTLWLINFIAVNVLPNVYLKYATGIFLELLADAVNLIRKPAVATVGVITFTRTDVGVATPILVDTIIQTASLNGKIYQLKVTEETNFVAAEATVDVPVLAVIDPLIDTDGCADFNLATGYYSVLPVPIGNIADVTNGENWLTTPGADIESDDDLKDRVRNQFGTASDFHTDSVYKSIIASFPGVAIDAIWFEHNAPRGAGTANAYVLFDFTSPVAQYLTDINAYITDDGHHGHGDDLQVLQMPEQNQILVSNAWYEPFLTAAEIVQLQTDIDIFINAAFRENASYKPTQTKPYDRFSFSKLAQELHDEFAGLHSIDFDLADIVSVLWIPRLTGLTVNMAVTE